MTYIGGGWHLKKFERGIPPLKRTKLCQKSQERNDYI